MRDWHTAEALVGWLWLSARKRLNIHFAWDGVEYIVRRVHGRLCLFNDRGRLISTRARW